MNDEPDFKPLVSFPDQSQSFVNGFEAGMVWQRMQAGEDVITNPLPYRLENSEVLHNMAEAAGYDIETRELEDQYHEWIEIDFVKKPPAPSHLRLVT